MSDDEEVAVKVSSLIEQEAAASDDEDGDDGADFGGGLEDGDGLGLDMDDEDDEDSDEDVANPRKRRLRRAADVAIDADELALLQENYRDGDVMDDDADPSAKRARRSNDGGDVDQIMGAAAAPSASSAADLAGALFADGDGDDDDDAGAAATQAPPARAPRSANFDNEMADFIIADEGDEDDEDDELLGAAPGAGEGYLNVESVEQRQTAMSIFPGLDLYAQTQGDGGDGLDVDEEEEDDDEMLTEEQLAARTAAGGGSVLDGASGFEPSQIKGIFATQDDEAIRRDDVPERLQRLQLRMSSNEGDFKKEVKWIVDQLLDADSLQLRPLSHEAEKFDRRRDADAKFAAIAREVHAFLENLLGDKMEVPYIFAYRAEVVGHLLEQGHGWAVQRLHLRYKRLARLRASLQGEIAEALAKLAAYDASANGDVDINESFLDHVRELRRELEEMRMPKEDRLRDLQTQISLIAARCETCYAGSGGGAASGDSADGGGGKAKAKRTSKKMTTWYAKMCKLGVDDLWRDLGVRSQAVGSNLLSGLSAEAVWNIVISQRPMLVPPYVEATPLAAARAVLERLDADSAIESPFTSAEECLKAFKLTAAIELASYEKVSQWASHMFSSTAVLTTTATVKGKEEIDQEHQYSGLPSLVAVPIHALLENPMLWARIRTAAKEGFLTLRLDVPGAIEQSGSKKWHARNDLVTAMGGDGGGPAWESVRKSIATQVLTTLFTKASRSSHAKMTALAHEAILNEACTSLRRKLVQAPIKLDDLDEGAFSLMRALTRDQLEEGGMYAGETPLPRQMPPVAAYKRSVAEYKEKLAQEGVSFSDDAGFSGVRILAAVASVNKPRRDEPGGYAVVVDGDGELLAYAPLPSINRDREREVHEALAKLVKAHSPHLGVVGLGTGGSWRAYATTTLRKVLEATSETVWDEQQAAHQRWSEYDYEDNFEAAPTRVAPPFRMRVCWGEDDVARIFAASAHGVKAFASHAVEVRMCASIARRLQEPLLEIAGLSKSVEDETLLSLELHDLQSIVSKSALLERLGETLIDVTNAVGVDVNLAREHKHCAAALRFVAGLGPRKAAALLGNIEQRGGRVAHREELKALLPNSSTGDVGPHCVWRNMAGFVRLRKRRDLINDGADDEDDDDDEKEVEWNPLDETRIHPDEYLPYVLSITSSAADVTPPEANDEHRVKRWELSDKIMRECAPTQLKRRRDFAISANRLSQGQGARASFLTLPETGNRPGLCTSGIDGLGVQRHPCEIMPAPMHLRQPQVDVARVDGTYTISVQYGEQRRVEGVRLSLLEPPRNSVQGDAGVDEGSADPLEGLEIEEFDRMLQSMNEGGNYMRTITRIVDELRRPYAEKRTPWRELTSEEMFWQVSGESKASMWQYKRVHASVQNTHETFHLDTGDTKKIIVYCELEMGSRASLQWDLPQFGGAPAPNRGDVVICKIKDLQPEKFWSDLERRNNPAVELETADPRNPADRKARPLVLHQYFDESRLNLGSMGAMGGGKKLKKRNIQVGFREWYCSMRAESLLLLCLALSMISLANIHPSPSLSLSLSLYLDSPQHDLFRNESRAQVIEYLKDKEVGEACVRPSSEGVGFVTVTWKVATDVYECIRIEERGKVGSEIDLGKQLWVRGESYASLDEVSLLLFSMSFACSLFPSIPTYTRYCLPLHSLTHSPSLSL